MRLYLDDNITGRPLVSLLRKAGHAVVVPGEVGLTGATDPRHFVAAIESDLVLLTHDRKDFRDLHDLVVASGGGHSGVLIVRADNDPTRDMTPRGITTAIGKLEASGVSLVNQVYVLNHWR